MLKEKILLVLSILVIAFSIVVIYFKMEYITRKELKVIILKDLSTKKENLNNYKVKFLKDGETYIYKINFKYENKAFFACHFWQFQEGLVSYTFFIKLH